MTDLGVVEGDYLREKAEQRPTAEDKEYSSHTKRLINK